MTSASLKRALVQSRAATASDSCKGAGGVLDQRRDAARTLGKTGTL